MIKPLLLTFGLALLAANAAASTSVAPGAATQPQPAMLTSLANDAATVATIDEDRVMAELLMG